jgi:penicillin-binding protein 2
MKYHCWKKQGHGYMSLKNAIKQSCDTYFYETSRLLGVDRLNETAKKFGLGNVVLGEYFNEKKGVIPSTKWKKEVIGQNWYLGETLINGIGQGYIQTTPLQLCLMTAQLANGGHKIYPKIISDNEESIESIKQKMKFASENNEKNSKLLSVPEKLFNTNEKKYHALYRNKENVKFVLDAMFRSTNEVYGTSFSSRIEDPKYQFAGKTGTAQVKRITKEERELNLKTSQIPYKERDHAWYVAFGPYNNPRYAVSILIEHGGSGSATAAPIAKKLFKFVIDRHELREQIKKKI